MLNKIKLLTLPLLSFLLLSCANNKKEDKKDEPTPSEEDTPITPTPSGEDSGGEQG